jgi:hypothetical protein
MDARIADFERRLLVDPNNRLLLGALRRMVERSGGDGIAVLSRFIEEDSQISLFKELANDPRIPHLQVNNRLLFRWFCSFEDSLQVRGRAPKAADAIKAAGLASIPGLVLMLNHPLAIVRRSSCLLLDHLICAHSKPRVAIDSRSGHEFLLDCYEAMNLSIRNKPIARWIQSFESSVCAGSGGGRAARALGELGRAAMPQMREYLESHDLAFRVAVLEYYEGLDVSIRERPEQLYMMAMTGDLRRPFRSGAYLVTPPDALAQRVWQMAENMGGRGVGFFVECYRRAEYSRWDIRSRLNAFVRRHDQARHYLAFYRQDKNAVIRALVRDVI